MPPNPVQAMKDTLAQWRSLMTLCFAATSVLATYLMIALIADLRSGLPATPADHLHLFMRYVLPIALALSVGIRSVRQRCRTRGCA
jgi:cytochrome bd-type quinol oxidase subunit 2